MVIELGQVSRVMVIMYLCEQGLGHGQCKEIHVSQ